VKNKFVLFSIIFDMIRCKSSLHVALGHPAKVVVTLESKKDGVFMEARKDRILQPVCLFVFVCCYCYCYWLGSPLFFCFHIYLLSVPTYQHIVTFAHLIKCVDVFRTPYITARDQIKPGISVLCGCLRHINSVCDTGVPQPILVWCHSG